MFSQEEKESIENDTLSKTSNFRFHFDIGYLAGLNASGDNFVSEGYDLNGGLDISTSIVYNKVTFHFDFQIYGGDVVDQEIVGQITNSMINRTSIGLGYNLDIAPRISLNPSLNYGSIAFRSELPESDDFRDDGEFVSLELKGLYEISQTVSLFASVAYYRDRLDIRTAPAQQDFFRKVNHLNPSIGLRFSSRRIKRKKGEPGDGIFTRRDGL